MEPDCQLADTVFSLITPDFTLTESETGPFPQKNLFEIKKMRIPKQDKGKTDRAKRKKI